MVETNIIEAQLPRISAFVREIEQDSASVTAVLGFALDSIENRRIGWTSSPSERREDGVTADEFEASTFPCNCAPSFHR